MRAPKVTTIDFETHPIRQRPEYPPKPVGFSIRRPGDKKSSYHAFGHLSGNNTSKKDAERVLKAAFASGEPLLFHNGKFDLDVAQTHMGIGAVDPLRVHDTMFLLFLSDPHAPDLQLKPSAERILGMPSEERDVVKEWVLKHKVELVTEHGGKVLPSKWGEWIWAAPGELVGKYADGDVERTLKLFNKLYPEICDRGMKEAYEREQKLLPIFLENERIGLRVDIRKLRSDVALYQQSLEDADKWLRGYFRRRGGVAYGDISLDNDADVAAALDAAGVIDEDKWTLTPTGRRSVSKKNLTPDMFNDAKVAAMLGYRNRLTTCLRMFMEPWLAQAERRNGVISTNWNQVRGTDKGTRTGRPSTNDPNFLNLSKTWDDKDDGYLHPTAISLPELPLVRRYILPDKNEVFLHRDFDGQELRVMAHFEDGPLMEAYQEDPELDPHAHVKELIMQTTGLDYHRTQVKITNFRRIYGGGAPATALALHVDIDQAKELLAAHAKALPGLKGLQDEIKRLAKSGLPIVTWGGREYFPEEPRLVNGRMQDFIYKLLNYLVQGSAADITKEAILRYYHHPKRRSRFLVTVYDEINITSAKKLMHEQMAILRETMEGFDGELDVKMLSSGKSGLSWGDLKKYEGDKR